MSHYRNFKTVVYCTAQTLSARNEQQLAREWEYVEKYVGLDKVYLETFRHGVLVDEKQMRMIQNFFQSRGVETAGGITTVIPNLSEEDEKRHRIFDTFCYSNEAMRNRLKQIAEYTASLFDEFILDDFFFTSCTCEDCIREKGDRSWADFRADKMEEVSKNLIIEPARRVNPNVRITIKYPDWRESYHETGYCPERQRNLFHSIYTGTETRNTAHTDQHLPRYLSYSLMRYMENVAPGRNGGGWFDTYSCWPIDCYLEQAYLTAFSRPKEITLFQWGDLYENKLIAPLGVQLAKIDRILDAAGSPTGVPVYLPFDSCGENHLEDHLGMQGIALEPVPEFPASSPALFLTRAALEDGQIAQKLEAYLLGGGTAVVTTGFIAGLPSQDWQRLSSIRPTGRKLIADRYQVTDDPAGYYENQPPVVFDELQFGNNASWSYLNAGSGDSHSSILLLDTYGRGKLFTLAVPEPFAAFSSIPVPVMDMARRVLSSGSLYISGKNVSLFLYDNGILVLYCYASKDSVPETVEIRMLAKPERLERLEDGSPLEWTEVSRHHEGWTDREWAAKTLIAPGDFCAYRVIWGR